MKPLLRSHIRRIEQHLPSGRPALRTLNCAGCGSDETELAPGGLRVRVQLAFEVLQMPHEPIVLALVLNQVLQQLALRH